MINLILGRKGAGKTKKLIELVNEAVEKSSGNVICVEKESLLTYNVNYRARLIAADDYNVSGYDAFYGFLSGICAGDHDITDVFVDATLRIGGRAYDDLSEFFSKVNVLSQITDINFTFTVSADKEELPSSAFVNCSVLN